MEYFAPVSDLRFYNQTLSEVKGQNRIILTKNGKPKYVVLDYPEYVRMKEDMTFLIEVQKGIRSLIKEPSISIESIKELKDLWLIKEK